MRCYMKSKPNPFRPGYPVDIKNFEGRADIIEKYSNYLNQSTFGSMENFFITGESGIGKSSFGKYLKNIAINKYNMISIHIYNDGIGDVESLIRSIIENLLEASNNQPWGQGIWDQFRDHIESVNIFGVGIKFKSQPEDDAIIKDIKTGFAGFLLNLINDIHDKKGIFIIIDNINGLADTPEFVNWYRSFTDTLTSKDNKTPIAIMLLGTPKEKYNLNCHNISFARIFHTSDLAVLKDNEVRNFFVKSFKELDVTIDEEALDLMVRFSSGQPAMMQEIGDAIYWTCKRKIITKDDALLGIFRACDEIGVKYLQLTSDNPITNRKYSSIFIKIGRYFFHRLDDDTFNEIWWDLLDNKDKLDFTDFFTEAMKYDLLEYDGDKKEEVNRFLSLLSGDEKKYMGYLILRKSNILNFKGDFDFEKNEIIQELDQIQNEVFRDFLLKAKKSQVLNFSYVGEIGMYKFTNNLFPLYCIIKYIESGER